MKKSDEDPPLQQEIDAPLMIGATMLRDYSEGKSFIMKMIIVGTSETMHTTI